MVLSMLGFAIEDMFIKLDRTDIPIGRLSFCWGPAGHLLGAMVLIKGQSLVESRHDDPPYPAAGLGEIIGTLGFVSAIVLTPISSASAILQATPFGGHPRAALFLGDPVRLAPVERYFSRHVRRLAGYPPRNGTAFKPCHCLRFWAFWDCPCGIWRHGACPDRRRHFNCPF